MKRSKRKRDTGRLVQRPLDINTQKEDYKQEADGLRQDRVQLRTNKGRKKKKRKRRKSL